MTDMTLNEAFYRVLHAKSKKDEKEAFKIIESKGYEIIGTHGSYWILNRKTGRELHRHAFNSTVVESNIAYLGDNTKIDLESFLNSPARDFRTKRYPNKSQEQAKNITQLKTRIDFCKDSLQEEIKKKQQFIAELENELNLLRKAYGLSSAG